MDNRIIYLDKISTEIDTNGTAHITGYLDNQVFEIFTLEGVSHLTASALHDRVNDMLKINDFAIKEVEPKPKRTYTKKVNLGFASDFGKVELKIAHSDPTKKVCYNLYIKGSNMYVYKIDKKGIYVCKKGCKAKPVNFSANDIKRIKNIGDFDVVKVELDIRRVLDKIKVENYD